MRVITDPIEQPNKCKYIQADLENDMIIHNNKITVDKIDLEAISHISTRLYLKIIHELFKPLLRHGS